MKTTNKMTVILLMLNHFNLFSKPYIKVLFRNSALSKNNKKFNHLTMKADLFIKKINAYLNGLYVSGEP
jgi:hypothetical protein